MAEPQERRNVGEIEPEGGQPSRNSGQTGPDPEERRIDIVELSRTEKDRIQAFQNAEERAQSQTPWPRIPKVPQILRGTQDFSKFYEPRVISIGPYHHGKPDLDPGEMIKHLCAQKFLANSNQDIEALYKKIKSNIEAVKKCYDWSSTNDEYDDEALAWMMLMDGCFLLYFILCFVRKNTSKLHDVNVKDHMISFVQQDLFFLENQLPFGVLKLIFQGAKFHDESPMEELIKKFVTETARPGGWTSEIELKKENEEPSHLLDLLRSALLGRYKRRSMEGVGSQTEQEQEAQKNGESSLLSGGEDGRSQPEQEEEAEKKGEPSLSSVGKDGGSQPEKELEAEKNGESCLLSGGEDRGSQPEKEQEAEKNAKSSRCQGGDGGFCCPWKKGKQPGIWQSFRHIKELKAAGIYVKPSRTSFLTDISFKSCFFCGYLKLPRIIIDDATKPKFLNIVAYEMCPDGPDNYGVTSYICFLDNLIDHADDVKELRSKHILYNWLGSDEDVARLFNEIANDLVDPGIYDGVKDGIQKHYDKRLYTWIAEALHDHCRSPWTIMAFIAAVLILSLTGVQTYYAVSGNKDD